MNAVQELLALYPFSVTVIVMVAAETLKQLISGVKDNTWFSTGGMPSSHSAFATSLLLVVGSIDGMSSTTFAIASVLAGFIWYDAAFVRSKVGDQAKALNILQQFEAFSERVGHSVAEVVAGIGFGGVMTWALLFWVGM
ncbi:MAG: divergent PAP2 family protein [bacterium]|nr:divergent PAP2 family protein [bacterium]